MKMKSTTLQKILWGGPPLSLDKNFVSLRRLKNKAALTAGASKQISAYATSCFEARTTNRIKTAPALLLLWQGYLVCLKVSLIK